MKSIPYILEIIPQRPPFVFVDSLEYADQRTGRSNYLIIPGALFVQQETMGEAGLLENMAQTAAATVGYQNLVGNRPQPMGYLAAIKNLEIFGLPKINQEIKTEIWIKNQIFSVTVIEGRIQYLEKLLVRCEMRIFLSNPQ